MNGNSTKVQQSDYSQNFQNTLEPTVNSTILSHTVTRLGCIALRASLITRQTVNMEANLPTPWGFVSGLKQSFTANLQNTVQSTVQENAQLIPIEDAQQLARTDREAKLQKILGESNDVLAKATTVFPFTFFPDDIVVDRTKVTLTKRSFFFTSEVVSIRIEDILHVKLACGPFLGSLVLVVRILNSEDHHNINFFWRKDAMHLKHIIHGYVIAQHNRIDCEGLSKDELINTLTVLGHDAR